MDPRTGRRTPARAALGALCLALSACGEARSAASPASAPAASASSGAAPAVPAAASARAPARPEPAPLEPALRARLEGSVSAIVARAREDAERRTKGAVTRAQVHVALVVRDLASGAEWLALEADAPHLPASNMKLATTAAALVLLGARAEFATAFEAAGPLADGVLAGDLVVRADGDPLVRPDGSGAVEGRLADFARKLRARGLARVTGDLVLDLGTFPEPGPGPEWPSPDQRWQEFCALAAGLTVNGGVLQAVVTPGRAGAAAAVELHPVPTGLRDAVGVQTAAGGKLDVRVGATATTATVKGTIPERAEPFTAEFAHPDPIGLFGAVLTSELERAGIALEGGVRRERGAAGGTRLGELRSRIADALPLINAESKNCVADQLFLHLGQAVAGRADRAGGAAATRAALERLGVSTAGFVQVDGSGLSRADRVTARQLAALVAGALALGPEEAALFRGSLAVAGESGTLEDRMKGTVAAGRVHAKTGWITGVSALSGVASTETGRELVFSILVEYPPEAGGLNTSTFKPMQDEILALLVGSVP